MVEEQVQHSAPAVQPLFRTEVITERTHQWLGHVLLEPRVSRSVFALTSIAAVVGILSLLIMGTYTRKERVNGWLVPKSGFGRIFPPQQGIVSKLQVHEGTLVKAGAALLTLSTEVRSETRGDTREEIVRKLAGRRASLESERAWQVQHYDEQEANLKRRQASLALEHDHLDQQIKLQRDRQDLAQSEVKRQTELRERGLTTEPQVHQARQDVIAQASAMQVLERNRTELEREQLEVQTGLNDLPFQRRLKTAELERSIMTIDQELAEAESRREFVVTAPHDGVVGDMQVHVGNTARPEVPLLSIVPSGAELQAHLFCPTRAVGFIRPGQHVQLRYRAFPYQKFGIYSGQVESISRAAISPQELPHELQGLSSLSGADEPVYRVTVDLDRQTVVTYGMASPLQAGMQLEADVQIERRTLAEWLLDPLYSLTGKL